MGWGTEGVVGQNVPMSDEPISTPPAAMTPIPEPPTVLAAPPAPGLAPAAPAKQRWKPWLIVGVIVALVAAMFVVRALQKDPATFPKFDERRPSYGTIRIRNTITESFTASYTATTQSNGDGSVIHVEGIDTTGLVGVDATSTQFEAIVSADELWVYDDTSSTWVKRAGPDASIFADAGYPLATLMASDYVPDSLRPFVTVKSVTEEKISGHDVTVYDLRLNLADYADSGAADYDEWAENLGITDPKVNTTLELAVDEDGVVWRMRSFSTLGATEVRSDTFEQLLEQLLPEEFEPPYPDTYFDEATGQQVG